MHEPFGGLHPSPRVCLRGSNRVADNLRSGVMPCFVEIAACAARFLEILENGSWDVAAIELGGLIDTDAQLLRRLRQAYPCLPVLAYCRLEQSLGQRFSAALNAGVTEVAIDGFDDIPLSANMSETPILPEFSVRG
jgi:hypothetical protein